MKTFIAQPLITEKSLAKITDSVYQFIVPTWANKRQIAEHVTRHFDVTVSSVNTSKIVGQSVRFKGKSGVRSTYKKATITLKKGDTIKEFSMPVETKQEAPEPKESKVRVADTKTESNITVRTRGKKATANGEEK